MWSVEETPSGPEVVIDTPVPMRYALRDPGTDWLNLEAILMDMDGSSTDTEKLVLEAMRQMMGQALERPQFAFAEDDFPNIIGDSTTNHVTYLCTRYGIAPARRTAMIKTYYEKYHATLRAIRDRAITDRLIEPMPHLREFLAWARERGLKVALVTSSIEYEVDLIMPEVFRGMDLDGDYRTHYDAVLTADRVGEPFLKPHPNLYILALEALGVRSNRALVIEDSTAGIVAGRLAGCSVAAVPHPHTRSHRFQEANVGVFGRGLIEVEVELKQRMNRAPAQS